MEERLYEIMDEKGSCIAKDMRLNDAITLVEALFMKYYQEIDGYLIKPMPFN